MQTEFNQPIQVLEDILKADSKEAVPLYRQHIINEYKGEGVWDIFKKHEDIVAERVSSKVFLRKGSPAYLNKGDYQLVLRLNEGWVAKASNYYEFEDFYSINICPHYTPHATDTIRFLNARFGFDIPFVTIKFRWVKDDLKLSVGREEYGTFMIVPDLTAGGKYTVRDISPEEDFIECSNPDELKASLDSYLACLASTYEQFSRGCAKGWNAMINKHAGAGGTPTEAIRRMFFLKIDPTTEHGQIVPGDFNHAFFYKKKKDRKGDR